MRSNRWGMRVMIPGVILLLAGGLVSYAVPGQSQEEVSFSRGDDGADAALTVFEQRILPIFKSPEPSSCMECHLGYVDLKDYISADQGETFASLRKAGLVNMETPAESKILKLIRMKPKKGSLVSEKARKREYEAFRAWLELAAKDPVLSRAKVAEKPAGPSVSVEVIRHARKDRLLASFINNIWSERQRCWNCHGPEVPKLAKQAAAKRKSIEKHGEDVLIWLKATPQESLEHLLKSERLINLEKPAASALVVKPTWRVKGPEGKTHGGGMKAHVGDRGYKKFLRFAEDIANIKNEKYATYEELPNTIPTRQLLRVVNTPAKWVMMQVDFHKWEGGRWSEKPTATGLSKCTPKFWIAPIELLASRTSPEFEKLSASRKVPPGKYQLRFYVDMSRKLSRNPLYQFTSGELTSSMELTIGENGWPEEIRHVNRNYMTLPLWAQLKAKQVRYPGKALPQSRPAKARRGG